MAVDVQSIPIVNALAEAWMGDESFTWHFGDAGYLRMDRPLPYLVVGFADGDDKRKSLQRIVASQPNHVYAADREEVRLAIRSYAEQSTRAYGCVLIVHLWMGQKDEGGSDDSRRRPEFVIRAPDAEPLSGTVEALAKALKPVVLHQQTAEISFDCDLQAAAGYGELNLEPPHWVIGVEIEPVHRHQKSGQYYPVILESLRNQVSDSLKQAAFHFARTCSTFQPPHYLALGPRTLSEEAQKIDRELTRIDASFDFLLQTTPINAKEAWAQFEEDDFRVPPAFHYRPLPVNPDKLKRRLFNLPVEKVDDPVLAHLFREKQEEVDRKLTMLRERDSRDFFLGSLQLFGEVQPPLLELAQNILDRVPERDSDRSADEYLTAEEFAERAQDEFDYYRQQYAGFPRKPEIRGDIPPGLMVSRGSLLIGRGVRIPPVRVEALLEHEVGTHMLTYYNGIEQPLHLLHSGLAGYEALQEGIAVVGEFLAEGITIPRLRVLAARVVAAHELIEESSFLEVFELLTSEYHFEAATAFTICMRTFRGGGFIKDVIYLRGLREVVDYLRGGGDFERLFVGKLALRHVEIIEELQHRGVITKSPLRPRMLNRPRADQRLERLRQGLTFMDFVTT